MSKVYVVSGFFRAVNNVTGKAIASLSRVLKAFDTVEKAIEYITYANPLKIMDDFPIYNKKWERDWIIDSTDLSKDQLTIWHRLKPMTEGSKHWLVILEIHEMEVE